MGTETIEIDIADDLEIEVSLDDESIEVDVETADDDIEIEINLTGDVTQAGIPIIYEIDGGDSSADSQFHAINGLLSGGDSTPFP